MRYHKESEAIPATLNTPTHDEVAEPVPEEYLTSQFKPERPPGWPFARCLAEKKVFPGQTIEVEAGKSEDWIVQVILKFDYRLRNRVVSHYAIVVC